MLQASVKGKLPLSRAEEVEKVKMNVLAKAVVSARITEKLMQGLSPVSLKVIDESHHHAGHGHHHPEGETHFRVEVISEKFDGKSRIDRHRLINGLLAEELAHRVHALAISAWTPKEKSSL